VITIKVVSTPVASMLLLLLSTSASYGFARDLVPQRTLLTKQVIKSTADVRAPSASKVATKRALTKGEIRHAEVERRKIMSSQLSIAQTRDGRFRGQTQATDGRTKMLVSRRAEVVIPKSQIVVKK
jgi:hypothetical protein